MPKEQFKITDKECPETETAPPSDAVFSRNDVCDTFTMLDPFTNTAPPSTGLELLRKVQFTMMALVLLRKTALFELL